VIRALPYAAAAIAGAVGLALVLALTGGGAEAKPAAKRATAKWTAPGGAYSIATPRGWKAVASGPAATVIQRADKRGVVVIRRRAKVDEPLPSLGAKLERRLRKQIPDFQPAGARLATVGGEQGLVFTFVRKRADQVQSVVVAPAGERSYTLDLVADGDAPDVARELAGMVRSFSPRR
jgi:hypothetical protein